MGYYGLDNFKRPKVFERIRSFVAYETVGLLWRIPSYPYFSLSSVAAETGV